ncbi:MAG: M13 family metallopeptidase [Thermoplasmataceae archaeon]
MKGEKAQDKTSTLPPSRKFSTEYMDQSVDPFTDFFKYANGKWCRDNLIPKDMSEWGTFNELYERNLYLLKDIAEKCAYDTESSNNINRKLVGEFYRSAMNIELINQLKFKPIDIIMNKVLELKSKASLVDLIPFLNQHGIFPFFNIEASQDKKNSLIYSFYFYQGGLSLPDRDYYLNDSYSSIINDFRPHIDRIFQKIAYINGDETNHSAKIIDLETRLAEISRSKEELRDEEKNYNKVDVKNLISEYSFLDLTKYMLNLNIPDVQYVIVGQPEFFKALYDIIESTSLSNIKTYLLWKVLMFASPLLHSDVEIESFEFFRKKLMGQQEPEPRWKKSVKIIDSCIGEALGALYAELYFGDDSRKKMQIMIDDIKSVFRERLEAVEWMTSNTRQMALKKFDRFNTKIGHPEIFRDYSSLVIHADDFMGNVLRSIRFEINRRLARVGAPVDKNEWEMSPPTVNAYFSPSDNEIVFPAGILQPPFFDHDIDNAVNYGAIGAVISHEITHGYDDQGRMYDAEGNIRDWWNEEDKTEFKRRAKLVIDLYDSKEVLPDIHVHGERTVGENIADFGGINIAYAALKKRLKLNPHDNREIDGLTPEQRFFISWAQIWRENIRDEYLKVRITVDPHAPNSLRATLPVLNHPDFEKIFAKKSAGDFQNSESEKISIW